MEIDTNEENMVNNIKFLVAMIIMMNPLGSLSIFLQLTDRLSITQKKRIALNCGVTILIIMILSIWSGRQLLEIMGIRIDAFRLAGGIILILTGLSMLQSRESPMNHTPEDTLAAEERHSIAIVPLAIPIIVGPGAISTLIIAATDYNTFLLKSLLTTLCVLLSVSMFLILYFGHTIAAMIGDSVIKVITRVMGMIIMAIAVSMLIDGLMGMIPALNVR